jgi:L-asparaginase II
MNIDAFLLCDCATDQGGKLNVLGAFDSIFARKMPAVHRACAIAARIRFEKIEEGEHQVRVDVVDEDGKAIVPRLDGEISVHIRDDAGSSGTNLILNLQGLKFERYGRYSINLAIDGRQVHSLPFTVREAASQD